MSTAGDPGRAVSLPQTSPAAPGDACHRALLRRGFALEYATLGWNVAGIIVLAYAAFAARSVALAGFSLDSLIEIGASTVVIWELSGTGEQRQRRCTLTASARPSSKHRQAHSTDRPGRPRMKRPP